jgi:hypothetical protein
MQALLSIPTDHPINRALRFIERHDGWVLHPGQDLHGWVIQSRDALDAALKRAAEAESLLAAMTRQKARDGEYIADLRQRDATITEMTAERGILINATKQSIAAISESNRLLRIAAADLTTRDATIADLRELLEFKDAAINDLRAKNKALANESMTMMDNLDRQHTLITTIRAERDYLKTQQETP